MTTRHNRHSSGTALRAPRQMSGRAAVFNLHENVGCLNGELDGLSGGRAARTLAKTDVSESRWCT